MGNRDINRTQRKRTEAQRFDRGIKRIRRARKLGTRWPRDRHYGQFGYLPTAKMDELFFSPYRGEA